MIGDKIISRVHTVERMFEREIGLDDVRYVLQHGEAIENYVGDKPYPSAVMLAWCAERPLHVVMAYDKIKDETILITAYEPDAAQWDAEFKTRRS
ncbi:MAG: DUF4258 domain-containing protein [Chloroflexi bacterium]|nr:DUF4258 domain-containing protein [Chloroflexota bacterium]